MMQADLEELMVVSCLFPSMHWTASETRPVLIGRDGNILRLYWMPLLLWLDECFSLSRPIERMCGSL